MQSLALFFKLFRLFVLQTNLFWIIRFLDGSLELMLASRVLGQRRLFVRYISDRSRARLNFPIQSSDPRIASTLSRLRRYQHTRTYRT